MIIAVSTRLEQVIKEKNEATKKAAEFIKSYGDLHQQHGQITINMIILLKAKGIDTSQLKAIITETMPIYRKFITR